MDDAAAYELLRDHFSMAPAARFTDVLALARTMHVSPAEVAGLLDHFEPGASVPARFERILDADFDHPAWEPAMACKDTRRMQVE